MRTADPKRIGWVKHVRGATITIALEPTLVGVTPLWEGHPYPVGQLGSLVIIPQGPVRLLGTVTFVGIAELSGPLEPSTSVQIGDRWLQVQLVGELDGLGRFRRGVSGYPGLDDPVHFTTSHELRSVFAPPDAEHVRIGALSAAPEVPFALKAGPLVTRHAAIVGSTGSGKTSAVATLIQNFVRGGWEAANILIVDPHGEYSAALSDVASVRSVLGTDANLLRVPYWALPAKDILAALGGGGHSATVLNRFSELVLQYRRLFVSESQWLTMPSEDVTADSPVPFDINQVWYQLDYDNRATYSQKTGGVVTQTDPGSAADLRPAQFQPHGQGSAAPFKGPFSGHYGLYPERIRARLSDPLFRFLQEPRGTPDGSDPLEEVVLEWLGGERPVTVLDFSGVSAEVTDLAVGVVLQLLFELAIRSREDGIGRPRPVLIMLEEAHRYLGDSASTQTARISANRIAREGRKYGIGIVLITQRPSELPDTALSQAGTVISLRLTNSADQSTVRASLPDAVAGLADSLPSLRTGEAVVSGESTALPARVQFDLPSPEPEAADPSLTPWRNAAAANEITQALERWRGQA